MLAHKIGHHLNGHTIESIGSQPENELVADEFSGFVLRRMGASLDQAQSAMKVAANYKQSLTPPGKNDRMVAIADGWNTADSQITGRKDVARLNASPARTTAPQPITLRPDLLADQHIIGDVYFNADIEGSYFITRHLTLVKFQNNQLYKIGKISPLENISFPFMIYDENQTLLLVDTKGNILTKSGTAVGVMKIHREG